MTSFAPPAPKHVFVYGYFGCGNVGDEMLLSAVASGIIERWPEARLRVRNLGRTAPEPHLRARVQDTDIEQELLRPGRGRGRRLVAYLRAAQRAMKGCDCFVLGGGTLIHAKTSAWSLAILTALIAMARLQGMPVIGLGLGANHLDGRLSRALTRIIKALSADLVVRDEASLRTIGSGVNVRLAADLVYNWWPGHIRAPHSGAPEVIAVTLWSLPPTEEASVLNSLAEALTRRALSGAQVRGLVFQDADDTSGGLSDRGALQRLAVLLERNGVSMEIVRPGATPGELAEAFGDVTVHCGARFHASVIASLLGIPSVGLATDAKVLSLCAVFGLPSLELGDIDAERLSHSIEQARRATIDTDVLAQLRKRSALNFTWFDDRCDARRCAAAATTVNETGTG